MNLNSGMLFEIAAASQLVREGKIHHGREISRGLTKAESAAKVDGTSQMIKVPLYPKGFRELDIVYDKNHIVECKDKRTLDTSQMERNALVAFALEGSLSYALPVRGDNSVPKQAEDFKKAFKVAYRDAYVSSYKQGKAPVLPESKVPNLGIEAVPVTSFAEDCHNGYWTGLANIATRQEIEAALEADGRDSY